MRTCDSKEHELACKSECDADIWVRIVCGSTHDCEAIAVGVKKSTYQSDCAKSPTECDFQSAQKRKKTNDKAMLFGVCDKNEQKCSFFLGDPDLFLKIKFAEPVMTRSGMLACKGIHDEVLWVRIVCGSTHDCEAIAVGVKKSTS